MYSEEDIKSLVTKSPISETEMREAVRWYIKERTGRDVKIKTLESQFFSVPLSHRNNYCLRQLNMLTAAFNKTLEYALRTRPLRED